MTSWKQSKQAKLKSVTFTGCWTCRGRKIKCDERQQNGCGVCEKAGLECAGYGVNLYWVTGDEKKRGKKNEEQEITGFRRRRINLYPSSSPSMSDEEITRILSAMDSISVPSKTVAMGPFAIFQANGPQNLSPNSEPERAFGDIPLSNVDDGPNSPPRWPSPLPIPSYGDHQTWMLLDHYTSHVADLLQPVLHPRNPWRTAYFPYALEACPEQFVCQTSTPPSPAATALFHSLLSSAAFHLRNSSAGAAKFHRLGLEHRIKALSAMNAVPIQPYDPQRYTLYLTAMLSLVTIDTMTGEDSDFPIHLRGCLHLGKPPENALDVRSANPSGQVCSIWHFLTLLARTTAHDMEPRPWPEFNTPTIVTSFDELPLFHSQERSIEYIYGVTPTLGNLLQRTCEIADYLAFYEGRQESVPMGLQEARRVLREEISRWTIDSESFYLIAPDEEITLEITRCQARAFHGAVRIFYHRMIELNSNPEHLEAIVQEVWDNLNNAEDFKDIYMGGAKRTAPMSWPAFIATCEAAERQRWVQWWERIQDYRIGNLQRQWRIIRDVWKIMETHPTLLDWRDALKQTGQMVLPV